MNLDKGTLQDRLRLLFKRNQLTLLAFVLPALIIFIAYMTRGIYPVGDRNVLTIDLYHQYAPFLAELQAKLTSGGSLFYTWAGGLGVNFYSLFAYYLSSPLNILLVLFPPSYLTEAILLLTVIKLGLCGAFFFRFLRGVWNKENFNMVAISLFYALSAYSLAYSWDIMWLDGVALLPLIMLGMIRLIRDKRYLLYCLTLGIVLISNYYISFFVVIFTVLYFPVCLFSVHSLKNIKPLLASVGRFAAFSAIGAGLSCFLLLPTYFSLQLTSAAKDSFPSSVTHYYDLFDYIGQHFMLNPPTIRDGMPNMYCGVLALILIPIYFLARSVPLKQKFLNLSLILVMILSFNLNVLNFIWHGFHYPNQLPYRNSFVYIFLILALMYPALQSLAEFTGKQIGALCLAAAGLVLLSQKLNDKTPGLATLYVTLAFIAIYGAVLTIDRIRRMDADDKALILLIAAVAEILVNTLITVHVIDSKEYYSEREGYFKGVEVSQMREELAAIEKAEDSFYRVESIPPKTINDGFMYGYNGLSIFASTMPTKPVKTFQNLGFHSNGINSYKYECSTIVLDSLFGIKYLIRRSGSINDPLRQLYVKTSEIEIYKNPYALSLGYLAKPEISDWSSGSGNSFEAQNRLLTALTGSDDVFSQLDQKLGTLDNMEIAATSTRYYSFTKKNDGQEASAKVNIINLTDQQVYLYLDVTPNQPDRGFVMIGEERVDFNAKRATLIDLGFVKADAVIEFNIVYNNKSSDSGRFELYSYGLDEAVFTGTIDALRKNSMDITRFTDTRVEGTVDCSDDGVFLLTVPYDKGWQIKVDGEPVEIRAIDGGLIGFNITRGKHTIVMVFTPEWFFLGLLASLLSILALVIIYTVPGGPGRRRARVKAAVTLQPGFRPVEIRYTERPLEADEPPDDPMEIQRDDRQEISPVKPPEIPED